MLDNLYSNIGTKIKNGAKLIFIAEAIAAIIGGICLMDELLGIIIIFCGPLVAYVSSWLLYAFGELVEDTHAIRKKICQQEDETDRKAKEEALREVEERANQCERAYKEHTESIVEEKFVPNSAKTVIPYKYKDNYSCPKCGCTLKFGQRECNCSWQMDWSKYE